MDHYTEDCEETTIQDKFMAWIDSNPAVEELFVGLACKFIAHNVEHWSMPGFVEIARSQFIFDKTKPRFKMANSYRSRLSRYLEQKYPDLEGFFTKSTLKRF